jgi:hypothetical protein
MFILLARDPGAPLLVEAWAVGRLKDIERGLRPDTDMSMVSEAQQCAANMRKWRTDNDGAWRKPSPSPAPHAGVTEGSLLGWNSTSNARFEVKLRDYCDNLQGQIGSEIEALIKSGKCDEYYALGAAVLRIPIVKSLIEFAASTAALARPPSAVGEEEIARVLYEAEYDADEYPWSNRKPSEKALYYQQARAVFALIERRS